jgi:hypothetical protein
MRLHQINTEIAARLDEVASLLEAQDASGFRVNAYRRAAETIRRLDRPVDEIVRDEGIDGLLNLPGVGHSLARSIHLLVVTGGLPLLDQLRGESDPVTVLASVPGVGGVLAERIHADLGITTLEELEAAAHDGRLAELEGFGPKRLAGIRDALAARLGRVRLRFHLPAPDEPAVSEILDVDREYRKRAVEGTLRTIAPRRFNPAREAWLPILHTTRGERHYTALFSNTARAHQFGKTRDWVVIYCDGDRGERQYTVITAEFGRLRGKRIVRGREAECATHYAPLVQARDVA